MRVIQERYRWDCAYTLLLYRLYTSETYSHTIVVQKIGSNKALLCHRRLWVDERIYIAHLPLSNCKEKLWRLQEYILQKAQDEYDQPAY